LLTVSERAKQELKSMLIDYKADPEEGFRLLPRTDGMFVLALDSELNGDQVVEYEGYKVLFVGIEYYRLFNGKTLDCQEQRQGTVLVVR
jgi:hypothetical protein